MSFARGVRASYPVPRGREYSYHAACVYVPVFVHAFCLVASDNCCTYHAQGVARKSFARASYPGRPSPRGIEHSYHTAGAMACTCLVHLHGINTLYHPVSRAGL